MNFPVNFPTEYDCFSLLGLGSEFFGSEAAQKYCRDSNKKSEKLLWIWFKSVTDTVEVNQEKIYIVDKDIHSG